MQRTLAVVVAVALAAGACSDGDDTASPAAATTTSVAAPEPGGPGAEPIGEASTDERRSERFATGDVALLTDVRVASQDGFERVVFEFADAEEAPGWLARYVEPPITEDPSDREVAIDGEAFVQVTMSAASAVDLRGDDFEITFEPDTVGGEGPLVREAVSTGDFEAVLTWTIGLGERVPFAIDTLADPPRVVVDFVTT